MTLENGYQLQQGRYTIQSVLGEGGMGTVYLATDRNLPGRLVAIKENIDASQSAQEQFQREAVMLARLTHPNLPRVTDHFVEPSGLQYLVMDYVEGDDLREVLRQQGGPLPEPLVLAWIEQVMNALEHMHSWIEPSTRRPSPIIHRDIKPGNIKRTPNGRIVLVDFGLAKYESDDEPTVVGARAFTPGYSPVEQYSGGTNVRSDIYALGATLYNLLTAQRPPDATVLAGGAPLPPPRQFNPQISRNTERVILRAMQAQESERFQSIRAMRDALLNRRSGGAEGSQPLQTKSEYTLSTYTKRTKRRIPGVIGWLVGLLLVSLIAGLLWSTPLTERWRTLVDPSRPPGTAIAQIGVITPTVTTTPTTLLVNVAVTSTHQATATDSVTATATVTAGVATSITTIVTNATTTLVTTTVTTTVTSESPTMIPMTLPLTVTPTPLPITATSSPTAGPTETATSQPTPTLSPTTTPSATAPAEPSDTPSPRAPPTRTPTATPSLTNIVVAATPTATVTIRPTATATPLPTMTPTVTATTAPTLPPSATATALSTPSPSPTATMTATRTATVTRTATSAPPPTATATITSTPTVTRMPTPRATATVTPPPTATRTATVRPQPTATPTVRTLQATPAAGDKRVNPRDQATYVFVPGGEFRMGSAIMRDEQPEHTVTVDGFWLGQTEVTNAQYARCVDEGSCTQPHNEHWGNPDQANFPVTHVDWEQANRYAQWVGGRLPTEAEWEKAARGSDGRTFPWGDDVTDEQRLNFNSMVGAVAVGSYPAGASPYGALDMAGNVEEWVADWYAPDAYAQSSGINPTGPADGILRVVRGGSFKSSRGGVRTSVRGRAAPAINFDNVGFRVVIPSL